MLIGTSLVPMDPRRETSPSESMSSAFWSRGSPRTAKATVTDPSSERERSTALATLMPEVVIDLLSSHLPAAV